MKWREFIATVNRAYGDSEMTIAATLKTTDIECPGFLDQEVKWKEGFDPDESLKVIALRTKELRDRMKEDPQLRAEVMGAINYELEKHSQKN